MGNSQSAIPPVEPPPEPELAFPQDGFATIPQGKEFLQVGRTTVYALIDDGTLASVKLRNARRIPWAALHKLANDAAQSSTSLQGAGS